VTMPFFYGWVIVVIVMLAGVLAAGVSNITMAVVLKPISDDLGWSRSLTAAAVTMGALFGGVLSPLFGPLADRCGPRVLLPSGGALVGLLAIGNAILGMALGLFASAFATTEFQAVQFMPAFVLPQILLAGLLVPRDRMAALILRLIYGITGLMLFRNCSTF